MIGDGNGPLASPRLRPCYDESSAACLAPLSNSLGQVAHTLVALSHNVD